MSDEAVGCETRPTATVGAYVALGSNLGDRAARLREAVRGLAALPETELRAVSALYETEPVGGPPQGPYLNAVAELGTRLGPHELLAQLLELERASGRARGARRNEPRTLDLDLLLYGALQLDSPELTLPHPRLGQRAFVLEPLCELAPHLIHPILGVPIRTLAARRRAPGAVRPWREEESSWPSSR